MSEWWDKPSDTGRRARTAGHSGLQRSAPRGGRALGISPLYWILALLLLANWLVQLMI